jgi:very-short-patch-repair endonuclease
VVSDSNNSADQVPLPQAGGVRGGQVGQNRPFKPRDTARARELRNAATLAERLLWQYLSRSQLGAKFSRQMPVENFYADFLCRERRLIVELDGFSHDVQPERDVWRDEALSKAGYRVLHFTNEDVQRNTEGVVTAISLAFDARPTPNPSRLREGGKKPVP